MRGRVGVLAACLVGLAGVIAGCADGGSSAEEAGPATSESSATSPAATPYSPPSTPIPDVTESVHARCGLEVPGRLFPIKGPDAHTQLAAAQFGRGSTVALLLHQTDGDGLCGWVPYARWLAGQHVRALAVDLCAYGETVCSKAVTRDAAATVRIGVRWARAHGARRVVVVGASMGGSYALGAGQAAGADAVVDLSGPASWVDVPDAVTAARRTTVPLLVAVNRRTDADAFPALRRAVAVSPAKTKRFVAAPSGHGWELVSRLREGATLTTQIEPTALGRLVLAWVRG